MVAYGTKKFSILKHLETDFVSLWTLVLISFTTHFLAELIYLLILKLLAESSNLGGDRLLHLPWPWASTLYISETINTSLRALPRNIVTNQDRHFYPKLVKSAIWGFTPPRTTRHLSSAAQSQIWVSKVSNCVSMTYPIAKDGVLCTSKGQAKSPKNPTHKFQEWAPHFRLWIFMEVPKNM